MDTKIFDIKMCLRHTCRFSFRAGVQHQEEEVIISYLFFLKHRNFKFKSDSVVRISYKIFFFLLFYSTPER